MQSTKIRLDDVLANLALAGLIGRHRAVGQHKAREPRGRKVIDEVLHPGEVGVAGRRHAVDPALVFLQQFAAPVAVVEGRIGQHVVGFEVRMPVVVEGVAVGNLRVDAADGEVHLGQPPRGVIRFLPVNGDVANLAAVGLDELLAAHEHPARAAAGVVHTALIRREHLHQHAHDPRRRVELPALLALGAGELREEILVDAAQDVLGAVGGAAKADVADQVDQLARAAACRGQVVEFSGMLQWALRLSGAGLIIDTVPVPLRVRVHPLVPNQVAVADCPEGPIEDSNPVSGEFA